MQPTTEDLPNTLWWFSEIGLLRLSLLCLKACSKWTVALSQPSLVILVGFQWTGCTCNQASAFENCQFWSGIVWLKLHLSCQSSKGYLRIMPWPLPFLAVIFKWSCSAVCIWPRLLGVHMLGDMGVKLLLLIFPVAEAETGRRGNETWSYYWWLWNSQARCSTCHFRLLNCLRADREERHNFIEGLHL